MAYIFDPIRNTFVDDEDTSLGNKLALNDTSEEIIRQIDEQFGPGTVFPASELPPKENPYKDFEDRNPMAGIEDETRNYYLKYLKDRPENARGGKDKIIPLKTFAPAFIKENAADGGMIGGGTIAGQDMGDRTGFATPINVYKEKTKSGKTTYRVKLKNDVRVPATSEEDAIQKLLADGQEIKYLGADKQQVLDWIKNSKNPVTTDEIADYIKSNELKVRRSQVTNAVKNNPEYEGKVILAKERRAPFVNEDGTIKPETVTKITEMINDPIKFPDKQSMGTELNYKGFMGEILKKWSKQTGIEIPFDRFRVDTYKGSAIAEEIVKAFEAQGDNPNIAKLARQFIKKLPGVNSINSAKSSIRRILVDYANYEPRPNEPKSENEENYYKRRRKKIRLAMQRMGGTTIKDAMDDILTFKNQDYVKLANENPDAIINNDKLRFAMETSVDVDTGEFKKRNLSNEEILNKVKRGDLFTEDHISEVKSVETAPKKSGKGEKIIKGVNIEYPTNKQAVTTNFNQSFLPNAKKYLIENPNGKNVQKIVDVLNEYGLQIRIGKKTYGTTEKTAWDSKTRTSPRYDSNFNIFENVNVTGGGGEGTSFKNTATSLKDKLDKSRMFTSRIPGGAVALTPLDFILSMSAGLPLTESLASAGSYLIKDPYLGKAVNVPLAIAQDMQDPRSLEEKITERREKLDTFLENVTGLDANDPLYDQLKEKFSNMEAGDQPEIDPFQAAEGGRVGFNGGGAVGADDDFAKELEYFLLNPDAELPKADSYRETMNPVALLNDMIDPRNYAYYADRLAETGIRIGEFGARVLPALGQLTADLIRKPAFKVTGGTGQGYVQDYTDVMPSNIKGTGIFTQFLDNLVGSEGTKVITEKIGLTDLIKSEEQKQKDRRSTIGPKVLADQVTLGAELTAPIFPGLKLLKAYAKNRKLPVNDTTKEILNKEIDEVLSAQNLTRRDFLKATGAGGTIILAKMLGFGDELATTTKVVEKATKEAATTGGVPPYFLNLVKKIKTMGDETMSTKDKATAYKYDDYYMEEDFAGNIEITRKGDMDVPGYEEVYMSYRVDEVPIKGKEGSRKVEEYEEFTARPDEDGKMKDVEDGVPDDVIEEGTLFEDNMTDFNK